MVWAKINIVGMRDLYLCSFYRPPSSDIEYLEKLNTSLNRIDSSNPIIWLAGDFNLPHIDWESDSVAQKCNNRAIHQQLLDIGSNHFLQQMVTSPTRNNNILDLFFTNNDSFVNRVETLPGMSDHDAVFIENNMQPKRSPSVKMKVKLYKKQTLTKLKMSLTQSEQKRKPSTRIYRLMIFGRCSRKH